MTSFVVVGDALLDRDVDGDVDRLCPDAPAPVVSQLMTRTRPGGAALAATLAARAGRSVTLLTAVADDASGDELLGRLDDERVDVLNLGCAGPTAEKVRIRCGEHTLLRLDRGEASDVIGPLNTEARLALDEADVVLVSDYGRGMTGHPDVRTALERRTGREVVWDPHPRGAPPVPRAARLVTPNQSEAATMSGLPFATDVRGVTEQAQLLAASLGGRRTRRHARCAGALLVQGDGAPLMVPATVERGDPCGAGDCFAASLAGALADGALPSEAVAAAVGAASTYIAAGGVRTIDDRPPAGAPRPPGASSVIDDVKAAGGTVVAAGGCFDLLHTGHLGMLQQARRLGDCLVVLLNSDASVRRLKGAGRPIVGEADRAALLQALACVDDVVLFDEDTPCAALERLRPDVFAKGGDYGAEALPEQAAMSAWGGQCVLLPYREGRSTTNLMQEVRRRGLA